MTQTIRINGVVYHEWELRILAAAEAVQRAIDWRAKQQKKPAA